MESGNSFSDEVVATPDPPPKGVPNPIHDATGAAAAGYAGALVAGVRTYGWACQAVVRALGPEWLESGWIDYRLRRPLFAGEQLTTEVEENDQCWRIECRAGDDRRVVLDGKAGLAQASWGADLAPPEPGPASEPATERPSYTLDTVPLNAPLRPLGAYVTRAAAIDMVLDDLELPASEAERYIAEPGLVHPYFLAGRMAPLTRHNFTYGPTIHVRSQIQHTRLPVSEREFVVGAKIVDAYERNEHWYQVLDGIVTDPDGEVCRIRHHTIFRPRGT